MNEPKRASYSRAHFKGTDLSDLVLDVTGFVDKVQYRKVNTSKGEEEVVDITFDAYLADSKVRRFFGESFVNEKHRVRFKVTYFSYERDEIRSADVKKGDQIQAMLHTMKVEQGTSQAGYEYKMVVGRSADKLYVLREKGAGDGNRDSGSVSLTEEAVNAIADAVILRLNGISPATVHSEHPQEGTVQKPVPAETHSMTVNEQTRAAANVTSGGFVCSKCGSAFTSQKVADFSMKRFGKYVCYNCQQGNSSVTAENSQPTQGAQSVPGTSATVPCSKCGKPMNIQDADRSWRKYNAYYCSDCEPAAAPDSPPPFDDIFEELPEGDGNPFYDDFDY